MSALVCITNNHLPGIRPCTYRHAHTDSCDGWQYSWNAEKARDEATGRPCTGCAPREARVGLLCWACWDSLVTAYARWWDWARTVRGIDRTVQRDNAGVRSTTEGHVNIPGTALAIDECWSYLRTLNDSALTAWVSKHAGARDAVQFTRAAESAYRTHEIEERTRKVRRVQCPDCKQRSFVRLPPEEFEAPVTVRCQNEDCGKVIREGDTDMWGDDKVMVVAEIEAKREKGRAA